MPADTKRGFSSDRLMDFLRVEMGFVKEFACSPFQVGSICPSSRALAGQLVSLARDAAEYAPLAATEGLIIDLGTGPGPVTGELLRAGISPGRIVAVERSPSFARTFRQRYRQVPLLIGDAVDLRQMLAEKYPDSPVAAIISSLPFRAIPRKIAVRILRELHETLLERGGVLIQYSYAWWMKHALSESGFSPRVSRLVLQNVPPARVEAYVAEPEYRPKLML
ncbi:putative Methyltransferase type 11 [uncultured delta proteobacterium]|uniref:Putative Methyltransferase type 11 n=1 Tax=uncultured delta proteobacterium TaxID=34034 RepID=A0A212KDL1_9DELT|nr:putative Methyltransferase type 11 [uncultured delta proteobacterium]